MECSNGGRGIVRLGDSTDHGGKVVQVGSITVVDDIRIARKGDLVACPKCKGVFPIVEGAKDYFDENIPVALDGHKTACGASLISSV
jgi:uncharacterized Zn-binding protein involved in type VI secretion